MMAKAELLIRNSRVWTGAAGAPLADWVAFSGNRIMALGMGDGSALIGARTTVVDGNGASVLPGLNDAHLHLFPGGLTLAELDLSGLHSETDLADAIAGYRKARPGLRFIQAFGAGYDLVTDGPLPARKVLDALCPDVALLIMAADFHTAWANSAALELAGVSHGAEVPEGSSVVVDAAGVATGVLLEFVAIDLVRRCNPAAARYSAAAQRPLEQLEVTQEERAADKAVFRAAMEHCASLGLTAVQNMDGSLYQLELLSEMAREEGLPLRVRMPFHVQPGQGPKDLSHAVAWRDRFKSEMLTCDFVKIFADGVIESGTAHMLAGYSHRPAQRGAPLFADDLLQALVVASDRHGFQLAVHCVGDGAVRQVLDAYQAALAANGWRMARHRIEHIEVINPADIPRFAQLGVAASMQPAHVPEGGKGYLELIGPERAAFAFAQTDLRAAGAEVILSSDWPVAPLSPFVTLQAALTRTPWPDGQDHRIGLAQALRGMTQAAAWVAHDETRRGTLTPGAIADAVLLDRDIFTLAPQDIGTCAVRLTVCNGKITYDPQGLGRQGEAT